MVLYFSMLMPVNLDARACLKNKNCTNQMLHFPFS